MTPGNCGVCRTKGIVFCKALRLVRKVTRKVTRKALRLVRKVTRKAPSERRGVWTGMAARILSLGMIGVADQEMPRYEFRDKVITHLARQARILDARQNVAL